MSLSKPLLTLPVTGSAGLSERAQALVFEDPSSRRLLEALTAPSQSSSPLLISGESGTGRELVARYVHDLGPRRAGPFLATNCAAFEQAELEAELFGREKDTRRSGAPARQGWLEAADGGTLFVDAVTHLASATQAKLVRALEEKQLRRLGARQLRPLDVRIIVASDVQLDEAVQAGNFRADLRRLLGSHELRVPPLRERRGDILPLARHFLRVYQQRIGIGDRTLSSDAEQLLLAHTWPGNIRELETVIHHALLRCRGKFITAEDVRLGAPRALAEPPIELLERAFRQLIESSPPNLHDLIDETLMRVAYRHAAHNQLKTARLLGISRNVVRARLIQYGEIAGVLRAERERSSSAGKDESEGESEPASTSGVRSDDEEQPGWVGENGQLRQASG